MLGSSAGGGLRVGRLIYVGSRSQLLLHKVRFEDGCRSRVRLCEMICTVKYLMSRTLVAIR